MELKKPRLIAYRRCSTQRQGQSGLGLEAQEASIEQYARSTNGEIVQTYTEVESGKRDDRPELAKAIAHAKRIKGKLVIAKLDRLARKVSFVANLLDSKVDFVACDNPHANKMTIQILAVMAEFEAEQISQRTKAALAAAKRRGVLLGSARPGHWQGKEKARNEALMRATDAARALRLKQSRGVYAAALPICRQLRDEGRTFQAIADTLNADGYTTARGASWNPMQVRRLLSA